MDSKPMSIQSQFDNERHRLVNGMTQEDRAWRKQWLKDNHESHESSPIPEARYPIC